MRIKRIAPDSIGLKLAAPSKRWRRQPDMKGRAVTGYRFALRKPEVASRLQIFEVDRPGAQAWKRQRLIELDYELPKWLHFVPVDFEKDDAWLRHLVANSFDLAKPAVSPLLASAFADLES